MENLHKGSSGKIFGYARKNRHTQTVAEKLLWMNLRNRKLNGFKFRRQHPISSFIADFYCHERLLVVEVDGNYHLEEGQNEYDIGRTYDLEGLGIKVVRFTNKEVEEQISEVLFKILMV